jgi:hypothetical protein
VKGARAFALTAYPVRDRAPAAAIAATQGGLDGRQPLAAAKRPRADARMHLAQRHQQQLARARRERVRRGGVALGGELRAQAHDAATVSQLVRRPLDQGVEGPEAHLCVACARQQPSCVA